MRILASAITLVALTVSAFAAPPVPRKSPEFTITDPSGKQILLSSFKGKVVVMPLMFTTCPHCQREAQMLRIGSQRGRSSVGRASASQAEGRGFEPRRPLGETPRKPESFSMPGTPHRRVRGRCVNASANMPPPAERPSVRRVSSAAWATSFTKPQRRNR